MRYEFPTPEEVSLAFKALECIQVIVENNCLDNKIPLDRHNAECKWCKIYELAHAGTSPSCRSSHIKWEEKVIKLHDEFAGKGLAE